MSSDPLVCNQSCWTRADLLKRWTIWQAICWRRPLHNCTLYHDTCVWWKNGAYMAKTRTRCNSVPRWSSYYERHLVFWVWVGLSCLYTPEILLVCWSFVVCLDGLCSCTVVLKGVMFFLWDLNANSSLLINLMTVFLCQVQLLNIVVLSFSFPDASSQYVVASFFCSLAVIARKRPTNYNPILSALLDFDSKFEMTKGGHIASIQYSIRTAFLGFLRCSDPVMLEVPSLV